MPDYQATYEKLCQHAQQTALLASVVEGLEWDEQTCMPPAAGPHRAEQLALLAGLIHQRDTAPEVGEWLSVLATSPLAEDPHSDTGVVIRELQRKYDRNARLPGRLVSELSRASSLGQQAWIEARRQNDFARFAPLLAQMVKLKQEEADAVGVGNCRYDALLDHYEPHETTANVATVLKSLGESLLPLVERIQGSTRRPDPTIFNRPYPLSAQVEFGERVAKAIGYDMTAGRIDVAAHPFCATLGPRDVRVATRYDGQNLQPGLFSILHEVGHGLYEQGLPAEHFGLPIGETVSLGIHESQSRMWEILVGRSRAFWEHWYPPLQQAFPTALADVARDDYYFAVNEARPSLIRVEADEATYNLHILVRFELEQMLLEDQLALADLPDAWNAKYEQYLGMTPPDDASGVLQDVHWSAGMFGYFPTYALGNLYAAQFFAQAEADLGDLPAQIGQGQFTPLCDWLRTNIHRHAQRYPAAELVERVTGRPLSSDALLAHLEGKFGELYGF